MSGILWLASYPKSGNTWLRLMLESLRRGGAPVDINRRRQERATSAASRRDFDELMGIEASDLLPDEIEQTRPRMLEALAGLDELTVLKVHDAWTTTAAGEPLLPPAASRGAVYLVRDPRDVAVSLADHMDWPLDRAIAAMAAPDFMMVPSHADGLPEQLPQRLSSWSGHVAGWRAAPLPLLLLRYEDMLADPAAALSTVAGFAGLAAPPAAVAGAVEATRFARLRAQEDAEGFIERLRGARFFREGRSGGWRTALTHEQAERILRAHGAIMRSLGYD